MLWLFLSSLVSCTGKQISFDEVVCRNLKIYIYFEVQQNDLIGMQAGWLLIRKIQDEYISLERKEAAECFV